MKKYLTSLCAIVFPGTILASCPSGYISITENNFYWASSCEGTEMLDYGGIEPCSVGGNFCLGGDRSCFIIDALFEGGALTLIDCGDMEGSFNDWFTDGTCPMGGCYEAADTDGDGTVSYDEVAIYADALCMFNTKSDAAEYLELACEFLIDGDYSVFSCKSGQYINSSNQCQTCPGKADVNGRIIYGISPGTGDITTCYIPAGYTFSDAEGNTYLLIDNCTYKSGN